MQGVSDTQDAMRTLEDSMFREYDLRGVFGRELTAGFAGRLGAVYCSYLRKRAGREQPVITLDKRAQERREHLGVFRICLHKAQESFLSGYRDP